jgi:hypothetical protein
MCWGAKTSTSMSVALSQSHILLAGRCRQQRFRVFQFFILYICRLDGCKFAVLIWEINFYSRATLIEVDVFAPQHIWKVFVEGFVPIFFVNKCVSSVTCDTFHHNHSPSQHTFLHLFHYTPAPRRGRSAIKSCWEKCDEKCAYMFNVHKNQLSR